jgi:TDG/mug DNA glycosylase family protein
LPRIGPHDSLESAAGRTIPDVVGPGLRVLFCGINPGLMSGARGQHFARPGNRFWKVLHAAGFTDEVLTAAEQWRLLDVGVGITNLVRQASRSADTLTAEQLRQGARRLEAKAARLRPGFVAVLGMQAYRVAFGRPGALAGEQPGRLGPARLWVLPNPSGLQASYSFERMVDLFRELAEAAAEGVGKGG